MRSAAVSTVSFRRGSPTVLEGALHDAPPKPPVVRHSARLGRELTMRILVAYASRHGATKGIAERIAARLGERDMEVTLAPATDAPPPDRFDAVVVGGAAYMGHWMSEATTYVRRHGDALAARPVWLFSSGPIGSETEDAKGRDLLEMSRPVEGEELRRTTRARDWHVFFGAFDPDAPPVGLVERLGAPFLRLPSVRKGMPSGDFRDWRAIDAWADEIADALLSGDSRAERPPTAAVTS